LKNPFLLLLCLWGLCLVVGCGGGDAAPLPPPPGPATHLSVNAPGAANAGTAFLVTVTALDASGNVAVSYTGTVHFTSSDPYAILPADSGLPNGTKTFSVTFKTAFGQTISVTDTVTASISGPSTEMLPRSGVRRPSMHSIVVVFPAQLGPIKPKISPSLTSNDTSSTATVGP
jgi:hypothetical protein